MEIVSEGKNFRLVQDDELPEIMNYLEKFMPEASKVRFFKYVFTVFIFIFIF